MNKYEVMYVIDTALDDQARTDVINRFSGLVETNGGTVERVDEWGKRRLAYAINYKTEGYYVLMYMSAPPQLPRELERNFKISDAILRYLVTRMEGDIPEKRMPPKAYVVREDVPAGEPAREAEAPAEAPKAEEPAVTEAEPADAEAPTSEIE